MTEQRTRVSRPLAPIAPPPEVTTVTEVLPPELEPKPKTQRQPRAKRDGSNPSAPNQPKAPAGTPAEQQHEMRQQIMKANPVQFLIDVMLGKPAPVLDLNGEIVRYDQFDPVARAAAADRLLKRVLPELKSTELSVGGGGISFVLSTSFPVPGGARQLEAQITPAELATGLNRMAAHNVATLEGDHDDDDR